MSIFARTPSYQRWTSGAAGTTMPPDWTRWTTDVTSVVRSASTVIAGPTAIRAASSVVSVAARGLLTRCSRRACTGFSTIAKTAAQPSGARNGATTLKAR